MKDKILFFLYSLNKYQYIKHLYLLYYHLGIKATSLLIGRLSFVENLYLKGSYNEDYFVPVVSDLDFLMTGTINDKNKRKLKNRFALLHLVFPFIADYDFYSFDEMDYLRNFSGIKYFGTDRWKCLKGEPIGFSYRYYPRKFYIDIVQEIYFQFIWVFNNLKRREKGDTYRSLCIQRQYDKIVDLIKFISDHDRFSYDEKKFEYNEEWSKFTNEEIILKFNKLISNNAFLNKLGALYLAEFENINFSEILAQDYYQNELDFIDDEFEYQGKLHYYTRDNFKLFYLLGCIDSYLMLDWCEHTNDNVGKHFVEALYFSRLIEGRSNRKHDRKHFQYNQTKARVIKELIIGVFPELSFRVPKSHVGKKVFITAYHPEVSSKTSLYVKQILRTASRLQKEELSFVNLNLESGKQERLKTKKLMKINLVLGQTFQNVDIYSNELMQKLWQRENLLLLGVHWCFGADLIILADNYLEIEDEEWLKKLEKSLQQGSEFVLGYGEFQSKNGHQLTPVNKIKHPLDICNDVFLWAAGYRSWRRLSSITKMSWGYSTNELFHYQLLGRLPVCTSEKLLDNNVREIFKEETQITNINSIVYNRLENNNEDHYRVTEVFSKEILKKVTLNPLGLLETTDDNIALFEYLYHQKKFNELELASKMEVLINYNQNYGYVFNNDSFNIEFGKDETEKVIIDSENSFLVKSSNDKKKLSVQPYNYNSEFNLDLKICWHFITPPESGLYYMCFETSGVQLNDISIEVLPKELFLHGSQTESFIDENKIKVAALFDGDNVVNIRVKLRIQSNLKVSVKFKGFEKITYDENRGYPVAPPYNLSHDSIRFSAVNGTEYLFTFLFDREVNGSFYITTGIDIIWPVKYSQNSNVHYVYLNKSKEISEITIRNNSDSFEGLIQVNTKLISLDFITKSEDDTYTVTPTEKYIDCNYPVVIEKEYKLNRAYLEGVYLLPIKLKGEFPLFDSKLLIKLSPNGVLDNGIDIVTQINSNEIHLPISITEHTTKIQIHIEYLMTWSRRLDFIFKAPVLSIDYTNKKYKYLKKYEFVNEDEINLGLLGNGVYKLNLVYTTEQKCELGLMRNDNVLWPIKFTGEGLQHEYEFSCNGSISDTFLIDKLNSFSQIKEVILSQVEDLSFSYFMNDEEINNHKIDLGNQSAILTNRTSDDRGDHELVEKFKLPLEQELLPGNYCICYRLRIPESSEIDHLQIYHHQFAALVPHFSHDYYLNLESIDIPLTITESIDELDVSLSCLIRRFDNLQLTIESISRYSDNEFQFFRKIANSCTKLGSLYKGFYKIVLFFLEDVEGVINLKYDNKDIWYPIYTNSSSIHVFYFSALKEMDNVDLEFLNIRSDLLTEIHILKSSES
jgi:hypothetical protein